MRVALIGTGKTGGAVQHLVASNDLVGPFNSRNPATSSALQDADVVIVFVEGAVMADLVPLLIESAKPVVTGATNVPWPDDLNARLIHHNLTWIWGANFSMA